MEIFNAISGNICYTVFATLITFGSLISIVVLAIGLIIGIVPPMYRFGLARWRKVAYIVGNSKKTEEIKRDLELSGIVRKKNIKCITQHELNSLKNALLMVICADDLTKETVLDLLKGKSDRCGAIVYTETTLEWRNEINSYQHVSLVNMRGRLANEVVVLLLSTSFTRKDL